MDITEVRIKIIPGDQDRLLGFCSITIDGSFVVRDLKIIRGTRGLFVAMPSRKLCDRCHSCGGKNQLLSAFCSSCGSELNSDRSVKKSDGKAKLYADIAHPINSDCRELIQSKVVNAYEREVILAQKSGYVCRYDDFGENDLPAEDVAVPATAVSLPKKDGEHIRLDANESRVNGPHETDRQRVRQDDPHFGDGLFS